MLRGYVSCYRGCIVSTIRFNLAAGGKARGDWRFFSVVTLLWPQNWIWLLVIIAAQANPTFGWNRGDYPNSRIDRWLWRHLLCDRLSGPFRHSGIGNGLGSLVLGLGTANTTPTLSPKTYAPRPKPPPTNELSPIERHCA